MYVLYRYTRLQKKMVSTRPRQIVLSLGQMSLCSVIQRTSKHLEHNSSAHFSRQTILSVLSSLPKGQAELKVGQGKEKTLLPTGRVHLNLFLLTYVLYLYTRKYMFMIRYMVLGVSLTQELSVQLYNLH